MVWFVIDVFVDECILFSGVVFGVEVEFGVCVEWFGMEEVNYIFEGYKDVCWCGIWVFMYIEFLHGDVSL